MLKHRFLRNTVLVMSLAVTVVLGCAKAKRANTAPVETFHWVQQPITFQPPPDNWRREGDNGGGMLGVRFVLADSGGQCISVLAHRQFADRDRSEALAELIARCDTLSQRDFLDQLSLARARLDNPISDRELGAASAINSALDRAMRHHLDGQPGFAKSDVEDALRAAQDYRVTLAEALPHMRLRPERKQDPARWVIAYERDTTLAGHAAFASDDTLFTDERPLLYREIFWTVNGAAFKAVYQGTEWNLPVFTQLVDSIMFPEAAHAAPH